MMSKSSKGKSKPTTTSEAEVDDEVMETKRVTRGTKAKQQLEKLKEERSRTQQLVLLGAKMVRDRSIAQSKGNKDDRILKWFKDNTPALNKAGDYNPTSPKLIGKYNKDAQTWMEVWQSRKNKGRGALKKYLEEGKLFSGLNLLTLIAIGEKVTWKNANDEEAGLAQVSIVLKSFIPPLLGADSTENKFFSRMLLKEESDPQNEMKIQNTTGHLDENDEEDEDGEEAEDDEEGEDDEYDSDGDLTDEGA